MKKMLYCILTLSILIVLVGCSNDSKTESRPLGTEYHPSGFDGGKLYINIDGDTLVYERYQAGIGSLTRKTVLDTFCTETKIEGIVWDVYSTEEYPDLSYVLVISGTNASWTYRIPEKKTNDKESSSNTTGKNPTTPPVDQTYNSVDQIYEKFGPIEYTCDLSVFPTDDIRNWFGEIIFIEDGKLLISPGYTGKYEFGEVVWLISKDASYYSVGQIVTYTFCDVKAPDKEGEPLNIIALEVYME